VLFFLSGAAALVYEVVWMRMLSFVFGNTTYAVSVVLAVFLEGLAIGAFIYGRVADRGRGLLRVYGLLEAGAAAIALVLPLVLLRGLTPVYTWIYQRAGESTLALTAAQLVLSGGVLLAPAILLGGTLPLLIRFIVRGDRGMDAHIGRLYGVNTLGAVTGSFAAGYLLLPFLGLGLSNAVGAGLGFCVGAAALLMHRVLGKEAGRSPEWRPAGVGEGATGGAVGQAGVGKWLLVAFALSGFAALAYQVLWARLLAFFLDGTVYAFSAMLCVYLLGLALGSLVYSVVISRSPRQVRWFVILEVIIGLSAGGTIPVFLVLRGLRMESMTATFRGQVEWMFVAAAAIMIVPTVLIGAVFPLVCGVWARSTGRVGASVGQAYVVNTVGTVAGSLLAGFVIIPAIGTRVALFAMAGVSVFAGLMVWTAASRAGWGRTIKGLAALAAPVLLMVGMQHSYTAEDLVHVYQHGMPLDIEWMKEGIDGTVTVERGRSGQDALFGWGTDRRLSINGINVAGTRIDFHTTQKLQAHLGLLVRPGARRVLQVGFGSGGTAYSASLHHIDRIDCVEISRAVIEAAHKFEETNHGVLRDHRVNLYMEDARSFVKHARHLYDVILSDSSHPILAGEGLLYSVDYLRDCAARLRPEGIFSTWLPVYGMQLEHVKVMVRSIREVFPYVYVWHTSIGRNQWCIVHGMMRPLEIDYEGFAGEMAIPAVEEDLARIGLWRPEEVLALLLYDETAVDRWLADGEQLNTDDNGYLEFMGPRGTYEFAAARHIMFLFTFPDIVLSSGGSILDDVKGGGGPTAAWRERLGREVKANRHVLRARLYELALQDAHNLLALAEYRRALAASPGHFVAETMLGIQEAQLASTRQAAAGKDGSIVALGQMVGASVELGRLAEAAEWAELMARHSSADPGPSAVVAVLREDPEEVRRVVERRSEEGQGQVALMGIPREMLERLVETQRAVGAQAGDVEGWRELGELYQQMATAIRVNTQPVSVTSATLRLRGFRVRAVAELGELAAGCYGRALELAPSDARGRYRLALVQAVRGEYRMAIELLEGITEEAARASDGTVRMGAVRELTAKLREMERNPFGFLEVVQEAALAQVVSHGGQVEGGETAGPT